MRNYSTYCAAGLILVAGGLCGCAPRADMEQVANNQFQLRGMIASDRQQMEKLDLRLSRLEDQLQETQHGSSEKLDTRLGALDDRVAKLEAAVTGLRAGAPGAAPPAVAPGMPGEAGAPPLPAASGEASPGEAPPAVPVEVSRWRSDLDQEIAAAAKASGPGVKVYRQGLEAMKSGSYSAAIEKFGYFQKKYPKSPLTEPSEYFSANAFYELGKYDQSILQFNDLVMRFPKGRFASAALLREAQAFVQLKDGIDARLTLQKLIADHADAPEASAANAMMRDLEKD